MQILKLIFQTKTGRTALGGILLALGGFAQGTIALPELIGALFIAFQTINLRHGIEKKQ